MNKIKTQNVIKYFIIICIIALNYVSIYIFDSRLSIFIQGVSIIALMFLVDFDLCHPYVWFGICWYLYSYSFYIDNVLTEYSLNILQTQELLSWTAYSAFVVAVGPSKTTYNNNFKIKKSLKYIFKVIFILSIIAILMMCMYSLSTGANTKKELALIDSAFITLGMYGIQFMTISFVGNLVYSLSRKEPVSKKDVFIVLILSISTLLIMGERDVLFRLLIITLFIINMFYKRIHKGELVLYGSISLLLLSVAQNFKSFLLSSSNLNQLLGGINLIPSEFYSAGRNLYMCINNNYILENRNYLFDLIGYVFSNLPFVNLHNEYINSTAHFNNYFYSSYVLKGGGKGFTLIGDVYVSYGVIGVLVSFILLGFFVKYIYSKSSSNVWFLLSYLLFSPMVMYCLRADFFILISYLVKYIIIPYAIIIFMTKFKIRRHI